MRGRTASALSPLDLGAPHAEGHKPVLRVSVKDPEKELFKDQADEARLVSSSKMMCISPSVAVNFVLSLQAWS